MIEHPTTVSLDSQWVKPPELEWIMNVGHCTVADWNKKKLISHFRDERIIRYPIEDVRRFILSKMVWARPKQLSVSLNPTPILVSLDAEALEQLARLQALGVAALMERRKAA